MNQERVVLTRARIKKQGKNFEVVVDPQLAAEFKEGKLLDIKEALKDIHVYSDANKGLKCKAEELKTAFGTDDALEIAKEIITKGNLPETADQRSAKREQKKKEIMQLIKRYGVDPRTNAPHPETRIENALAEAKARNREGCLAARGRNDCDLPRRLGGRDHRGRRSRRAGAGLRFRGHRR